LRQDGIPMGFGRRMNTSTGTHARRVEIPKSGLVRLARELRERLPTAGEPSRDYFLKAFQQLEHEKSTAHTESKLECLDSIFRYLYGAQDTVTALRVARSMERLSGRCGHKSWSRKSKTFLAISLADAGDLQGALLEYRSALCLAREIHDAVAEGTVLQNIGAALFYAGLYSDAMNSYEQVCSLAESHSELAAIASGAYSNMAQVCLRMERYEVGLRYVAKSLLLPYDTTAAHYNLHRVILERVYVELALGVGDRKLADERLAMCLEYARRAQTLRTAFEAKLARGLCEIDHGDTSHGLAILAGALQNATVHHEFVLCLTALMRAHEHVGDVEQALKYADQLCARSADVYQAVIDGFVGSDGLPAASLRGDQLHSSIMKRTRLRALAAERQAAETRLELIERLSLAAELRNSSSHLHGYRVGRISALFARHLGLRENVVKQLEVAGRLHDIGKIGVPDHAFGAEGQGATAAERQLLRAHATLGAGLLAGSALPELRCAELVAKHHHERWNGQGYPDGLAGKRIPVECRIIAIADCFDATIHGRPHAKPASLNIALAEIEIQKGQQFDPELVDPFCAFLREVTASHADLQSFLEGHARHATLIDALGSLRTLISDASHDGKESQVTNHTRASAW
jgi:putative two-component system response regulator